VDGVFATISYGHKYKKGNTNNLVDMLLREPTSKITTLGTLMHTYPFTHDSYKRGIHRK
jgi:hypothetical protein